MRILAMKMGRMKESGGRGKGVRPPLFWRKLTASFSARFSGGVIILIIASCDEYSLFI